jgi:hypothetical protein
VLQQLSAESTDNDGDYNIAVSYARIIVGRNQLLIHAELRRVIRRVVLLLARPGVWVAIERIAAALIAKGSLERQAALAICNAQRLPFAGAVSRQVRTILRDRGRSTRFCTAPNTPSRPPTPYALPTKLLTSRVQVPPTQISLL